MDALTALEFDGPFLEFIKDTQQEFICIAKGPIGFSEPKLKQNGVHEGDCLSPTLFCLVLNMYFLWLRSKELGYEMKSAPESPLSSSIEIPVNDMALIGKDHAEATQILTMLKRFLSYYGMELNAAKCGY
jgi:hypothetical protein